MESPQKKEPQVAHGIPIAVGPADDAEMAQASRQHDDAIEPAAACGAEAALIDGSVVDGTPLYSAAQTAATGGRFTLHGYQDVWAAVLFGVTLVAQVAVFFVDVEQGAFNFDLDLGGSGSGPTPMPLPAATPAPDPTIRGSLQLWAAASVLLGLTGGCLVLLLLHTYPLRFIIACNVCIIAYFFAIAGVSMYFGAPASALMAPLFWAAFNILWLWCVRKRIPFSTALLKYAADVIFRYKATVVTCLVGMLVLGVYLSVFGLIITVWVIDMVEVAVAEADGSQEADGDHPYRYLICIFMFFFFWSWQVVTGVVRVTVCGVSAAVYFFDEGAMPRNPTLGSAKRALTTSFGSVCLGSLFVAIIEFMRMVVNSLRRQRGALAVIACIFSFILYCLDRIMQYFNKWAFAYVAIYGKSFIEAGKAVLELMRRESALPGGVVLGGVALQGVISQVLVVRCLNLAALASGIATGVLCGLGSGSAAVGLLASFIGLVLCRVMLTAIDSSLIALFVCFAEAPEQMQQQRPELYATFQETIAAYS